MAYVYHGTMRRAELASRRIRFTMLEPRPNYARLRAGASITIATGPSRFTRANREWHAEGWKPGQRFTLTGSASNDGTLTVLSVNGLRLDTVEALVAEGAQTDLVMESNGSSRPVAGLVASTTLDVDIVKQPRILNPTTWTTPASIGVVAASAGLGGRINPIEYAGHPGTYEIQLLPSDLEDVGALEVRASDSNGWADDTVLHIDVEPLGGSN